ncbi:CoA transferase [Amycolatopsis methanolica]|uniref:CoA transferase n=1 Tax=Amycolatopsis methanolica TaxID=1814 RepID=UPI0009D9C1E0|nr:CoA transferase [Amycolatopsis methanolica]
MVRAGRSWPSPFPHSQCPERDHRPEEPGGAAAVRLAASADVVVDNFRPGVLDQLGVGYDMLTEQRPSKNAASVALSLPGAAQTSLPVS